MYTYDVIIVGAGAAGLMAANELINRKKSFLLFDMGPNPARKILISGGGKCNFTNLSASNNTYYGYNPSFVISALAQFSPQDMLTWVKKHAISYIETQPGRFFCKHTSNDIVCALLKNIPLPYLLNNITVSDIQQTDQYFKIYTNKGVFTSHKVIIATGGASYTNLITSNLAQNIAKKFGHKIIPIRPALCAIKTKLFSPDLAGISLPVKISINNRSIEDNLLFTHFGIGGPAVYRTTLFDISNKFIINFLPNIKLVDILKIAKQKDGKKSITSILSTLLPTKLAKWFYYSDQKHIADYKDIELEQIANHIHHFEITDAHYIGLQSAEVTYGGIDTTEISSKTMESKLCKGLFFVGECLDITGDLGGFNLQWAFSSGIVAARNV